MNGKAVLKTLCILLAVCAAAVCCLPALAESGISHPDVDRSALRGTVYVIGAVAAAALAAVFAVIAVKYYKKGGKK